MAKSKKNKSSKARRFFKFLGSALLVIGVISCFIMAGIISTFVVDALNFEIEDYQLNLTSSIVYTDADGNPVEYEKLSSDSNRIWVTIDQIPKYMQEATVAIEDERFYKHKGMDIKRTAGAFLEYITGNASYGGSTITQQLVKNITNDKEVSPTRKIQEILRAIVLETKMDKSQILEFYLNIVYFGNGCDGVQSAALTYFDKDVSELSLAEAASIVGITQSPSKFDPFVNPEENKKKQELVLDKMLELGYLTESECAQAKAEPLQFTTKTSDNGKVVTNSYFTEALIKEVQADLVNELRVSEATANKMLYNSGLQIYCTVDTNIQSIMEDVFSDSSNFPKLSGEVQPQAAMVVMDPYNGEIKGVIGGAGPKTADLTLNRAISSLRQPGSTMKPIGAYGPALEKNILSPGSVIIDEEFSYQGWEPKNWYSGYKGPVTVRQAIVESMNIPAIKTVQMVGIDTSFNFLKKLGITSLVESKVIDGKEYSDKNLSALSIGGMTEGVSVKELTSAYATFANKGVHVTPHTYTKILDHNGKTILEKSIESTQVFSEQTAYLMTSMLESSAKGSMGISAKIDMPYAAKTGTTNDDIDRWFVAYTPYYIGGVWYGYDQPKTLPYSQTRIVSHKLWQKVMGAIHEDLEYTEFPKPSGITTAKICTQTGDLPLSSCPTVVEEFKTGMVPKKTCDGNHSVKSSSTDATPDASAQPLATPTASATTSPTVTETPPVVSATPEEPIRTTPPPERTPPQTAPPAGREEPASNVPSNDAEPLTPAD